MLLRNYLTFKEMGDQSAHTASHWWAGACWMGTRTHLHLESPHRVLWKLAASRHGRHLDSHAGQIHLPALPLCNCFHTCSDQDGSSTGRGTRRDTLVATRERHNQCQWWNQHFHKLHTTWDFKACEWFVTCSPGFAMFVNSLSSGIEGSCISDVGDLTPKRGVI